MDYVILDGGGAAIQFSNGDIVIYGDEKEAREDMRPDDILVGISYCPDDGDEGDDTVRYFCQAEGVNNNHEYGDFVLRDGDDIQDKLKDLFLPKIN